MLCKVLKVNDKNDVWQYQRIPGLCGLQSSGKRTELHGINVDIQFTEMVYFEVI